MRVEVKTELSKEDFRSYYRLNNKVHARLAFLFGKGGTILAVIMAVVLTILMTAFRLWKTDALLPYVLYLVFLIAWPLVNRFTMTQMYKANSSGIKGEYLFGDEEVQQKLNDMDGKFAYSAFKELYHSKGAYYMYIDKAHAVVLPERCFTQGDPAAFGRFIAEKTGLEVKEIK